MAVEHQPRTIHTPWGSLTPAVDLAPLLYLLVLYGLVYFLPFGVFEAWTTGEDGPVEWLQFAAYAGA
ncbi:MAG: pectate lyase, partial [Cyanobium sp.]